VVESGQDPVSLRTAVCSPGGTTVTALRELEKSGFRAAMLAAVEAGRNRTAEMGREGAR
jgi:pyrroline-5-carboxylate reductase